MSQQRRNAPFEKKYTGTVRKNVSECVRSAETALEPVAGKLAGKDPIFKAEIKIILFVKLSFFSLFKLESK